MAQPADLDLYLDESGQFIETSTDATEQAAALKQSRHFPSQLAGVLVPRGELSADRARSVLTDALKAGGLAPQALHARNLPRTSYDDVVRSAVEQIRQHGWQPVRLVNLERVRYGDRVANYANLVAELVLRICEQKRREGISQVNLRIHAARVVLGETPQGELVFLKSDEYTRRIVQYLAFAAVRRGLAKESNSWSLEKLSIRSGRDDPELQLCDLLSHASHDDFHPCKLDTAKLLKEAFGAYDFSLIYREIIERVDAQLAADAIGLAVLSLAEQLCGETMSPDLRTHCITRLKDACLRLAGLGAPARDQHLMMVVTWLQQIIEARREVELGFRLTQWFLDEIATPLVNGLAAGPETRSLDWFVYEMRTWAVTASNHRGAIRDAQRQMAAMHELLPHLAGKWEHASLLVRGLVAQAVHLTDCFEHDQASARMEVAAQYYDKLGAMFHLALAEIFPDRVRSDLYGRVLGTWLQSEILAGLGQGDVVRFESARRLSDRAIDEFTTQAHKLRQYQYRSQVETAAGNFAEARHFLARSLGSPQDTHEALATAICELGKSSLMAAGFAQLHWFQLGVRACLDGNMTEGDAFLVAVEQTGALDWPWSRIDGPAEYPAHGILRRAAVLHALRGETGRVIESLLRLASLLAGNPLDRLVLQTARLAAHAETAAVLYTKHTKLARRILDNAGTDCPGLLQLLAQVHAEAAMCFPGIKRVLDDWGPTVRIALHGEESARTTAAASLLTLARRIGY